MFCILYILYIYILFGGGTEFLKRCTCTYLMFALNVFNKTQNVLYEVITCCKLFCQLESYLIQNIFLRERLFSEVQEVSNRGGLLKFV